MNALVPASGALTFADVERLGAAIAKSGLFGIRTPEQAVTLMMIAHAEGRHPALAARDYDIIQNRPAKKAEAMLRDFLDAGGKVEWHTLTDDKAEATFRHPQGGSVRIAWDMARAQRAGLKGKDMYAKFPRQMLRSRCVSEGVRTVWPGATSGMYVPEEIATIEHEPEQPNVRDAINAAAPIPHVESTPPKVEPKPQRMTVGQYLDGLAIALKDARTPDEIHKVLDSPRVLEMRGLVKGAAKERLETMLAEAAARAAPPRPDGEDEEEFPGFADEVKVSAEKEKAGALRRRP